MALASKMLYMLAQRMYRTRICHDDQMKQALQDEKSYTSYRSDCFDRICRAADDFGVSFADRDVLDVGCNNGAITPRYLDDKGARTVVGIDVDGDAIDRAQRCHSRPGVRFLKSSIDEIPLENESVDVAVSYDVFEHVSRPREMTAELYRVVRPGGSVLIGTWGWYHPFAPHLFAVMPVPWAHVLFSEPTVLRACRLVYNSAWYVPNMHDLDEQGQKKPNKYRSDTISPSYLNKFFIRDFDRLFRESQFDHVIHVVPFHTKWAFWTRPLLGFWFARELFHSYVWIVLRKQS